MNEIFLKLYLDKRGFTFVEVIISISILSSLSILIYSIYSESVKNYIISKQNYMATVDCQNIIQELGYQLDKSNGVYNSDLFKSQSIRLRNLDDSNYSFTFDIVDLDNCSYLKFDDNSNFNPHLSEMDFQPISENVHIDDRFENRTTIDLKTDSPNINLSIENYSSKSMELNIYSFQNLKCGIANINSYSKYGKVKVNIFQKMPIYRCYIITVKVYNDRTNSLLKQIVDLYSYVPKFN